MFVNKLEKKMEAETKLTALKNQIMLIEEYGKHLVKVSVCINVLFIFLGPFLPLNWKLIFL
jgi:hypothetical protein